ncbi:MAG: DUF424 family protein [Methanomassiliicoccus sp.]|nr:DUF424 family protein [Methanomassiliicoccus sp.]
MITLRMHRLGRELVLAAADKDLLDKVLRDERLKLDVCREFYEGEDADEEMLLNRLGMCSVANLVGEETVSIAIREGFVDEECVLRIAGVPHAQLAKM